MRYISAFFFVAGTALSIPTYGVRNTTGYSNATGNCPTGVEGNYAGPSGSSYSIGEQKGEAYSQISPAVTILTPCIHWGIDKSDPVHIVPKVTGQAYYAQDGASGPTQQHQYGILDINYICPTVMLDHSDSYSVVYDPAQGLIINFSSLEAYNHATASWSLDKGLLMVANLGNCGDDGDYCYFQVKNIKCYDLLVCVASGTSITAIDAYESVDARWGTYYPSKQPTYPDGTPYPTATSVPSVVATATDGSITPVPTTIGGNDTRTDTNEVADPLCGPVDPKYGLPTAAQGVFFDEALDNCFGYEKLAETDYAAYLSGLAKNAVLEDDPTNLSTNGVSGGFDDDYFLDKNLLGLERRASVKRLDFSIPLLTRPIHADLFKKTIPFQIPSNKPPKAGEKGSKKETVSTPWGQGVLLKAFATKAKSKTGASADISLYCVECGASGSVSISGKASFLRATIKAAEVEILTDLQISFQLGVVANAEYSNDFDVPFAEISLIGLSFGIVTIGPQITVGADAKFSAKATGQLLAGAKFGFQNAKSVINFIDNKKSSSSGWTPQFTPVFSAAGTIVLEAEIGFPIGFTCDINIRGIGKLGAGIVERPAIAAKAEFTATIEGKNGSITETDGCKGIATAITFRNFLYVALNAFSKQAKFDLVKPFEKVLTKGCILIPGSGTKETAATTPADKRPVTTRFRRQEPISNTTLFDVTDEYDNNATFTDITIPDLKTTDFNTTDGINFVSVIDSTSSFLLTACSNGNLYFQATSIDPTLADYSCTTLFQSMNGIVVADALGRILHYYNNTISTIGVSRLRVHDEENIPKDAEYLSLQPSGTSKEFKAVDPSNRKLFPVVCAYVDPDSPPRLFVVADVATGIELLKSSDLEFIVTGGRIEDCFYLPIMPEVDAGYDFAESPL